MSAVFIRSLSRIVALAATAMIVLIGFWVFEPSTIARSTSAVKATKTNTAKSPIPDIPKFAAFQSLLDQKLRAPLYDPPPPKPEPPKPPEPIRVDLRLVGTVLEPGRNQAMLADQKGKIIFCRVGDAISSQPGGISLESVSETDAVLRVTEPRDELVTLTIESSRRN